MVAHGVDEREGVPDVVGVVLDGLLHALSHGLVSGEVDDAVHGLLVEDALQGLAVVDVGAVEGESLGGLGPNDLIDAVEHLLARVGEVVDDHDLVALLQQADDGVAADEPAAARDEHAGVGRGLLMRHDHHSPPTR